MLGPKHRRRRIILPESPSSLPVPFDRSPKDEPALPAELFRLLVEGIRDYAIFVLDPEGHVLTWNPGAQALKGYTRDEIVGKHFSVFYPTDAVQSGWPQHELTVAAKEGRFADEGWRIRKDGSSFWASVIISALRDSNGKLSGFAKVTQDLTIRRQAEERVQVLNRELRERVSQLDETRRVIELRTLELQKLSTRLLQAQDEERRRIARELHDDLGQQMAAIKMALLKSSVEEANRIVDAAAASVRNLSYLLHPPLLDETGLRASLLWYVEGMTKRSNIEISLTFRPQTFPRLSKDIERTIFRVVQESLTNVYRHANTKNARIEIEWQSEVVTVRIRDFGKGVPELLTGMMGSSGLGVGISGMRERVRQFGGDLTISRAEPGTIIEAKIPLFTSETTKLPD
jgi:PAS domain S-box-containing protein